MPRSAWNEVMTKVRSTDTVVLAWLERFSRYFDESVSIQAELTKQTSVSSPSRRASTSPMTVPRPSCSDGDQIRRRKPSRNGVPIQPQHPESGLVLYPVLDPGGGELCAVRSTLPHATQGASRYRDRKAGGNVEQAGIAFQLTVGNRDRSRFLSADTWGRNSLVGCARLYAKSRKSNG